jgi:hypothetical protein
MANLYELYETDNELEKKGICLQFGEAKFYVKRAGGANEDFDKKFEEKTRSVSNRLQLQALSEEQSSRLMQEVYFESVMINWEGVTDRKGNPLPYNRENFLTLMRDLPVVWRALRTEAANHENFRKAQIAQEGDLLGN